MSLLKKASIITTPTAYAEDYLYSIKPAYALGSELVTNGDFSNGTNNWTPNANATLSVENGRLKVAISGAGSGYPSQDITTEVGKKYRITANAFIGTSTKVSLYSVVFGFNDLLVDGSYDLTFKATSTTTQIRLYVYGDGTYGFWDNVSVKEVTDADFDFDRNSTGTRVNEDYLIEDVPYNICKNTEVFNNWTKFGTPTIEDNNIIAPNGTLTGAKVTRGSNATPLRLGSVTFLNQQYTYSIYAKKGNHNQINIDIGDETGATYTLTDDWQRFTVTSTPTANTHIDITLPSSTSGDFIYVWGAQVVKGDQPKDYLKTTDRLDIPRIDYTNGEPSILLEPSRTNDILNNTNLSQWLIGAGITVTSNAVNSPEGIQNADKIEKTSQSYTYVRQSLGTGNVSVFSIFVKQGNYRYIGIRNNDSGHSVFDFETKSFVTLLSDHNLSVQQFPNGWLRLIDERTISTNTNGLRGIALTLANGTELHSDIPLNAFAYVWGGQLENNQTYATSLIHTSGSAVTRSADAANNAGNSDLINSTEGVLYAEIKAFANDSTNRCISLYDGTVNNRLTLLFGTANNSIRALIKSSGSTTFDEQTTVVTSLEYHKIAVKYKLNDFALYVDGVEIATDTSGATPVGLNEIAFDTGNGGQNLYGNTKMIAVFKEALTDEELKKLTGYNNHELYMNYYNRLSYLGLAEEYNVESDINNYIL